jgi:hypothetical protein
MAGQTPGSQQDGSQQDGAIRPRGYWRTWQPILGATYATSLTRLRAWSNVVTTLLYLVAAVLLAYYFLIVKSGTLLAATLTLLVPWAIVVGIIEYQKLRLARTLVRNLAAHGKTIAVLPRFGEVQFLRWKAENGVTTDDLQDSAPLV